MPRAVARELAGSAWYRVHDVVSEHVGDEAGDVAARGAADPDRVAAVAPAAVEGDQVRAGLLVGYLRGRFIAEGEPFDAGGQGPRSRPRRGSSPQHDPIVAHREETHIVRPRTGKNEPGLDHHQVRAYKA